MTRSRAGDRTWGVPSAADRALVVFFRFGPRNTLAEPVTDVLVERGNREVAVSMAGNMGPRFSDFGYSTLVQRARSDGGLALSVWARSEIPPQDLPPLFA